MFLLFTENIDSAGEAKNILINKQVSLGKTPETLDLLLKEHISKNESISETAPPPNPPSTPPAIEGDLNNDGVVDKKDVDELEKALLLGDLNKDGYLDYNDYTQLAQFIISPSSLPPLIPDLNGDNKVDIKDLNMLGDILKKGDLDKNGFVDKADLDALKNIVDLEPTAGNSSPFGLDSFKDIYTFVPCNTYTPGFWTEISKAEQDLPDPNTVDPTKVTIDYQKKVIKLAQALFDYASMRYSTPEYVAAIDHLDKHIEKILQKYNPSYKNSAGPHAATFYSSVFGNDTAYGDLDNNGKVDINDLLKCYTG